MRLDVGSLPALQDLGFTGGRDSFRAFCARAFSPGAPRFLRSEDNALVVFRHADLRACSALPDVGNLPPAAIFPPAAIHDMLHGGASLGTNVAGLISNQLFTANPPLHRPLRAILLNQLGPRQTGDYEALARRVVSDILDGLEDASEIDLAGDVAEPLAARFFGAVIGMTGAEMAAVADTTRRMAPMFLINQSLAEFEQLDTAAGQFRALIESAVLRTLAHGGNAAVERAAAELAPLDFASDAACSGILPGNIGAFFAGNFVDAFHTAALSAALAVYVLLSHPDARAAIRADRTSIAAAVGEAWRLEPPVLMLRRYALADLAYDGMIIPAGTQMMMLWAAGNHDPAVFAAPARFDPGRLARHMTTFGGGAHLCPGRTVATMLATVLIEALEDAAGPVSLSLADDPYVWRDGTVLSQLRAMPVAVRRITRPAAA